MQWNVNEPFLRRWWTKNHATSAALTRRNPNAASEMPIMTRFGVLLDVSSVNSAGIISSPAVGQNESRNQRKERRKKMKNKTRKYNIKYAGENKTINKFEMKWGNCNKSWHRERRQCRDLGQYMGRGGALEEEIRGVSPRLGSAMQNWRKSRSRMKSRNEISLVRCCCGCCCWPHGTCSGAARTLDEKKKKSK